MKFEILATIAVQLVKFPSLRVGQIIGNAMGDVGPLYYTPDERLLNRLKEWENQVDAQAVSEVRGKDDTSRRS